MYTEMVQKRGYSLAKFADLVFTNAAKFMGIYSRKCALAPGSDADACVLDPELSRTVAAARLQETDYTTSEGYEASACPSLAVLRGKVMMESGEFKGDVKDGKLLKRKIAEEVWQRPVV